MTGLVIGGIPAFAHRIKEADIERGVVAHENRIADEIRKNLGRGDFVRRIFDHRIIDVGFRRDHFWNMNARIDKLIKMFCNHAVFDNHSAEFGRVVVTRT
jgi:hypothetical protein